MYRDHGVFPLVNISGSKHATIVVFGIISDGVNGPEFNFHTPRSPGCPRKKITFFVNIKYDELLSVLQKSD